ncbi:hypothetical protein EJB05_55639, partial [Eragrostis curvula]
ERRPEHHQSPKPPIAGRPTTSRANPTASSPSLGSRDPSPTDPASSTSHATHHVRGPRARHAFAVARTSASLVVHGYSSQSRAGLVRSTLSFPTPLPFSYFYFQLFGPIFFPNSLPSSASSFFDRKEFVGYSCLPCSLRKHLRHVKVGAKDTFIRIQYMPFHPFGALYRIYCKISVHAGWMSS